MWHPLAVTEQLNEVGVSSLSSLELPQYASGMHYDRAEGLFPYCGSAQYRPVVPQVELSEHSLLHVTSTYFPSAQSFFVSHSE